MKNNKKVKGFRITKEIELYMKLAVKNMKEQQHTKITYCDFISMILIDFLDTDIENIKTAPFRTSEYPVQLYQTYIDEETSMRLDDVSKSTGITIAKLLEKALYPWIKDYTLEDLKENCEQLRESE